MEQWLVLGVAMLATGAVAGVLAGLFGIGGGIVIVPVLETTLGFLGVDPAIRMHVAVGTSLATIIPTSISSARAHHRRNSIDFTGAGRLFIRQTPDVLDEVEALLNSLTARRLRRYQVELASLAT